MFKKINNNIMGLDRFYKDNWKTKNERYILEIEKFLDTAQSIKDENLRQDIIIQMLKCDNELTISAEKTFEEKYNLGIKSVKTTDN